MIKRTTMERSSLRFTLAITALLTGTTLTASHAQTKPIEPSSGQVLSGTTGTLSGARKTPTEPVGASNFENWWNGKGLLAGTGNPVFDARSAAEKGGFKLSGNYQGAYFGVIDSEKGSRGFWDEQINFGAEANFGKILNIKELEGITAFGNFRYRDSARSSEPNQFVEANSMFNPTNWGSGTQFRVLSFGTEITSAEFLPIKDMITFRGGWLQPQKEFIDQPLSKLFLNTAVNSAKGVGGNIPFSSSFSTWGGTLKVKLHDTVYIKNGLFMSYPQATASTNHGLAYQGYAPDTGKNGLFYMGEAGYTPKLGAAKLPGKYAFGGYYYGTPEEQTTSWNGTPANGRYGFYFQADQMIFREATPQAECSAPSDGKSVVSGKTFKETVEPAKVELSKQGLDTFNLVSFAPGYAKANNFPFYFQSGLVYTGLIPHRDKDLTLISIGYGAYQGGVGSPSKDYTAVIEGGYRYQLNGWSYVQPFFQYFSHPNGTADVQNATVLGFLAGAVF